MTEQKPKVTLIGKELAKKGLEFVYEGATTNECKGCKVKRACNNLHPGRRYQIVNIRATHHDCPIHLNGACAVEVVEASIATLLSSDMAIKNSRFQFISPCSASDCRSFSICHAEGIVEGEKYMVTGIGEKADVECEKSRSLKHVTVRP